jgi:hypothetical protein
MTALVVDNYRPDQAREKGKFSKENKPAEVSPEAAEAIHEHFAGRGESLSRPMALMGFEHNIRENDFFDYLEKNGQEWPAQELPEGIERGEPQQCYKNASLLSMQGHGNYCEGIAYVEKLGTQIGFLHAWVVDKDGKVIDNTFDHPEKAKYFGVKYDKKKYARHLVKTKVFGVFGGDTKAAEKVIKKGGL